MKKKFNQEVAAMRRLGVGCCLALFTLLSFVQADVSVVSVVPVTEANFQGGVDSAAVVPEGATPHLHAVTGSDAGGRNAIVRYLHTHVDHVVVVQIMIRSGVCALRLLQCSRPSLFPLRTS